jgi:hypothetical protein
MARQRDLERAGWQFVRIRGGDFYRDSGKATEPLWSELDSLGIKPGGIDEAAAEPPSPADRQEIEQMEADEVIPVSALLSDQGGDFDSTDADSEPAVSERGEFDGGQRVPSSVGRSVDALLSNYVAYSGRNGPDPRTVNIGVVADSLCLIIEAEGPMIAKRALRYLFTRVRH